MKQEVGDAGVDGKNCKKKSLKKKSMGGCAEEK